MPDSFWTGGPAAYEKGLKQEFKAQQKELKKQLANCKDQATRQQIETLLFDLEEQYRQNLNDSDRNIH